MRVIVEDFNQCIGYLFVGMLLSAKFNNAITIRIDIVLKVSSDKSVVKLCIVYRNLSIDITLCYSFHCTQTQVLICWSLISLILMSSSTISATLSVQSPLNILRIIKSILSLYSCSIVNIRVVISSQSLISISITGLT